MNNSIAVSAASKFAFFAEAYYLVLLAHIVLRFKNSSINLPFNVVRYFCLGLVGLLGMVMVSQLMTTRGCM
ncbi:MAG: hypothetical protein ABI761_19425 [Saprospiraceae bacterium]